MIAVVGGYGQGLTMRVPRTPLAGETVSGGTFSSDHGGKGSNQAVAVRRLGVAARIVTSLGDDTGATAARALWAAENVEDHALVVRDHATMTGFIIVDPTGENRICIADGALAHLTAEHVDTALADLGRNDVVLVSLEVAHTAAARALEAARARGALAILNPAPVGPDTRQLLAYADIITPNRGELGVLAGREEPVTCDDVEQCCVAVRASTGFTGSIVVTLGSDGVLVDDGDGTHRIPPVVVPTVVDTTGAGDTFSAALAASVHDGAALTDAAAFAVAAGALAVTREQVIPSLPNRADVDRLIATGGTFS